MSNSTFRQEPITWRELDNYNNGSSIYRGHRCAEWNLETSLERLCKWQYGGLTNAEKIENAVFREFRRRLHHYYDHVPERDQRLRWLSLMQHHGAPTRFLDWTYSIYIAAYFALEKARQECAVWMINKKWLKDEGERLFKQDSREAVIFKNKGEEEAESQFYRDVVSRRPIPAVVQVNPFQLDERLTIQKGVFLYPCDVRQTFENNLRAMTGHDDPKHVIKLVISDRDRIEALTKLHAMIISRATLFPGLDGFAQSLSVYHPLWYEEISTD
jgi:hypothetical protein